MRIKAKEVFKTKSKHTCCPMLEKQKPEIETYIRTLVEARDDFGKTKWAWGIITSTRQITESKGSKKRKAIICQRCKSYIEPRMRLAELVILGSKG